VAFKVVLDAAACAGEALERRGIEPDDEVCWRDRPARADEDAVGHLRLEPSREVHRVQPAHEEPFEGGFHQPSEQPFYALEDACHDPPITELQPDFRFANSIVTGDCYDRSVT
jgi:hypothetical protein